MSSAGYTFKSVSLAELSKIRVSYELAEFEHEERILRVIFEGKYRDGSAGNPDAEFMCAVSAAGVAAFQPFGVIFDFSKLDYAWGDMLEVVYGTAPTFHHGEKERFAVLVGPKCREAIRTLELGVYSAEPLSSIPWAHETLQAACEYLQQVLADPTDPT